MINKKTQSTDRRHSAQVQTIKVMQQPWRVFLIMLLFGLSVIFIQNTQAAFSDDEGCLICHKYPRMTRVTEDGAIRSYYVMPGVFANTVHRNVPCRDCHSYIKQLPHREVKEGVQCNAECHSVKNPATGKPFSHKAIYNAYKDSVHGREKSTTGIESDKPYCITCHTNPIYDPNEAGPPEHIVDRCVLCHEDQKFVVQWYKHTSRRIRDVKRSSEEIVQLCSSCHDDKKLIDRHVKHAKANSRELGKKFKVAVESYEESFHGKLTRYGFEGTANCLDCHAESDNYYKSVHEIKPSRDPLSPVHKDNRVETCKRCHTRADANYANIDPHPTAQKDDGVFRHYAEQIYNAISYVTILGLVGLSLFETFGRRRDGVAFRLRRGSSWRRKSKRGRNRVE